MLRELILDTETTGLSRTEDYVVEIGAVEMIDRRLTGREFHVYCRPPKPMPRAAENIHGISDAFLADKPPFERIVDDFLAFLRDSTIVAHNGPFDLGMLNGEMKRLGRPVLGNPLVDTIDLSKRQRPGKKHNLDAICKDYGIDLSRRTKHGALLDASILAEAYVELLGGRQARMDLSENEADETGVDDGSAFSYGERLFVPRITPEEFLEHASFVATLKDPVWRDYSEGSEAANTPYF